MAVVEDLGMATLQPLLAQLLPQMKLTALLEAVQVRVAAGYGQGVLNQVLALQLVGLALQAKLQTLDR